MRALTTLCLVVLTSVAMLGQNRVAEEILSLRNSGTDFNPINLLQYQSEDLNGRSIQGLAKGVLADLNISAIRDLQRSPQSTISLEVPVGEGRTLVLDMMQYDLLTPDFLLYASSNRDEPVGYTPGLYYRGMVRGYERSVASLSVFNDEIIAIISNKEGNIVVGRLKGDRENLHVIYNDQDLQRQPDWECEMPDDDVMHDLEKIRNNQDQRDVGDCVRVYIEIDDDIVSNKGGATPATNYITGLFNEVITLYANDGIEMSISEILAWDTPAPYSGSSSSAMLNSYQANTGSFNGDLSHLVSYQASGGIAAGFSGICNSNPDNSKCFSSIDGSYQTVPTYSWSVMVTTHEMGHLIGSRHTHACVWNGNNTAIDGCAGQTEGSCPLPGNPSGGGTIMSYCHLQSVGINLANGFGPQPGDVVRGTVNATGNCLTACGGPPPPPQYCYAAGTDQTYEWIQTVSLGSINNTSGSDGGYGDYTSLSTNLSAGSSYTITCTPGFASGAYTENWAVWIDYNGDLDFDDAGEAVGSGSGSSTVNINFTVPSSSPSATTRMRVAMQYGSAPNDCGSFQYGEVEDYTVVVGGGADPTCDDGIQNGDEEGVDCGGSECPACPTCDDGVQNGDETGVDCGGPDCPACPTCDDGIQNGDETGVDCGGPDCPACPTCDDGIQNGDETGVDCGGSMCPACPPGGETELFAHYFESGWDGWQDGGSDCYRYSGTRSWEGNYSIRIRDNSGTASAMTSSAYDVSGASSLEIEFYFYPNSMETNEDFWVRYYDGSSWSTVAIYASGVHFTNNNFYVATVTLSSASYNFPTNAQFRFQCDASGNADRVYIDAVTVTLDPSAGLVEEGQTIAQLTETPDAPVYQGYDELQREADGELTVFPNPASDQLNIQFTGEITSVKVLSMDGVEVYAQRTEADFRAIDISEFAPGLYILMVESNGEWMPQKFVKY